MRRRTIAAIGLVASASLVLAGCGGDSSNPADPAPSVDTSAFPEGSTMAKIAAEGTISIGTKFDQPLFGLMGPDGKPTGFDVEIATALAGALGVAPDKIEWKETISANREEAIRSGQVDLIVATYTINDDRKKVVSFAGPYYEAGQSLLTLASNTTIQSEKDIAGTKVCTVKGSTPESNLLANFPDTEVVPFGAYSDCLEPLKRGQVDAISTDNVILAGFAADDDTLEVRGEPFTKEPYGIGLALEDTDFRNWINDQLERMFADGSWEKAWTSTAGTVLPTPTPPTVDRY